MSAVVALLLDLLMRAASSATVIAVPTENLLERGAAMVIAALFYATTEFWADRAVDLGDESLRAIQLSNRAAFVLVGLALIAWAIFWAVVAWAFAGFSISIIGNLLFLHIPSILAGAALLAWSKHISD